MPALPFLMCVISSKLFDPFQTQLLYKVRMVTASFLDLTLLFVLQDSYLFMISARGSIKPQYQQAESETNCWAVTTLGLSLSDHILFPFFSVC